MKSLISIWIFLLVSIYGYGQTYQPLLGQGIVLPTNTNGSANVQANVAGPATTTGSIDVTSLRLQASTLNSVIAACYTGTGFSSSLVTGPLTPLSCVIATRTTSAFTVTFSSSSNVLVILNASGANGAAGAAGSTGATGADGRTILNGSGVPSDGVGANGDFYLNTATNAMYGPKASGTWPGSPVSLVGPQGDPGSGASSFGELTGVAANSQLPSVAGTCVAANITGAASVNFDTAGTAGIPCKKIVLTPTGNVTSFVITGGASDLTVVFNQGGTGRTITGFDSTLLDFCTPSSTANKRTLINIERIGSDYYAKSCISNDPEIVSAVLGGTGFSSFTKGDLFCAINSTTLAKLPVGATTGYVLTVDPAEACGLKYAAAAGGISNEPFVTLTDASTISWDADVSGPNVEFILGGNRTLNVSNLAPGGRYQAKVIEDLVGSRGLAFGTGCEWHIEGGGTTIDPTNTAQTTDMLVFTYDGTRCLGEFHLNYGTQAAPGSMISSSPDGSCSAKQVATCTFASTTSGVLIVVAVGSNVNLLQAGDVSSCTDSGGGTYTRVGMSRVTATDGSLNNTSDMWYRANAPSGITSVTCTPASGTNIIIAAAWFEGAATSSPLIDTNTWTGNTATGATSTLSDAMAIVENTYGGATEDLCTGYTAAALSLQDSGNLTLSYKHLGAAGTETPANGTCGYVNFFTTGRIAIFQ